MSQDSLNLRGASFSLYIESKKRLAKWDRNQSVEYWQILMRWPQIANWRFYAASVNRLNEGKTKRFSVLQQIGRGLNPNGTIRAADIIDIYVEFGVRDWPTPHELKEVIGWKDLDSFERQKIKEILYWLGANDKPRNPRNHAPISPAYTSVAKIKSRI